METKTESQNDESQSSENRRGWNAAKQAAGLPPAAAIKAEAQDHTISATLARGEDSLRSSFYHSGFSSADLRERTARDDSFGDQSWQRVADFTLNLAAPNRKRAQPGFNLIMSTIVEGLKPD